jgi:formate dehydrogenase maturation protein FdhE
MAKKLCVKYVCSRCEKMWFVDYVEGAAPPDPPRLAISYSRGEDLKLVEFNELCESCTSACEGYLKSITKEKEPGAKKKPDEASSVTAEVE